MNRQPIHRSTLAAVLFLAFGCAGIAPIAAQSIHHEAAAEIAKRSPPLLRQHYQQFAESLRRDAYGWTPLMMAAAAHPDPEAITVLLELGENIAARSLDGWTALMFASAFNENPDVVRTLLRAGADLDARTRDAWSALFGAARYSGENLRFNALEQAIDAERGWTALFFAARFNPERAVRQTLIEHGADADARDEYGRAAADYCRQES